MHSRFAINVTYGARLTLHRPSVAVFCLCFLSSLLWGLPWGMAQNHANRTKDTEKCLIVELYVADDQVASQEAIAAAKDFARSRPGIHVVTRSVTDSEKAQQRLRQIAHYFRFEEKTTPVFYCCNTLIRRGSDAEDYRRQLDAAYRIVVYTRQGCSRCAKAKSYLPTLEKRYPGLEIVYRDITQDLIARQDLNEVVRKYGQAATSTPVFHFFDKMIVGFDRPETTGAKIQQVLDRWTTDCPAANTPIPGTAASDNDRITAPEVVVASPF